MRGSRALIAYDESRLRPTLDGRGQFGTLALLHLFSPTVLFDCEQTTLESILPNGDRDSYNQRKRTYYEGRYRHRPLPLRASIRSLLYASASSCQVVSVHRF